MPIQALRTARTGSGRPPLRGAGLVVRAAGLRAAGRAPPLAAGREELARPEEVERDEEVVRVATLAGYAITPATSRVTRVPPRGNPERPDRR